MVFCPLLIKKYYNKQDICLCERSRTTSPHILIYKIIVHHSSRRRICEIYVYKREITCYYLLIATAHNFFFFGECGLKAWSTFTASRLSQYEVNTGNWNIFFCIYEFVNNAIWNFIIKDIKTISSLYVNINYFWDWKWRTNKCVNI